MLRSLFGRARRREPQRQDPWESLVSAAPAAVAEADRVIGLAVREAAPELGDYVSEVVLGVREAQAAFETLLSEVEAALEDLCGRYDYRQLLFVSRLCAGLPQFRSIEELRYVLMRTRSADRWIMRFGRRDLEHDFMRIDEGGYSIGFPPDSLFFDAVVLHALAKAHARTVKESMVFNFMRLFSSKNHLPGPGLRFNSDARIGWNFNSSQLMAAANVYVLRHDSYNVPFARWGMDEVPAREPFALAYELFEDVSDGPYGGGTLFKPRPVFLDALFEYGAIFDALFVRHIGMPVEHLWATSRALARLGIEAAEADEGRLADWAGYTGTLPVARGALLDGDLEEKARQELDVAFPDLQVEQELGESVSRFVGLASSNPRQAGKEVGGPSDDVRAPFYPFMIHGDDTHGLWVVDYFSTLPFIQGLVDRLEFSKSKKTTGMQESDATIRTSVFDIHVAGFLGAVEGVEDALVEHREDPLLPNVKFYFEGGQDREIDVPLRLGEVLLTVQTWATDVDAQIEAGDYRAMKGRWEKVKEKLRKTDRRYTDYLLEHPEGRRCLEKDGLRYVLPVVCGPHTEPVASFAPEFWLRGPSFDDGGQVQAPPMPRIITPMELMYFLSTATEQELKDICERGGWKL